MSRCCFAEDAKKFIKIYKARAQPFLCLLNLLFSEILFTVVVVVFLNSLMTLRRAQNIWMPKNKNCITIIVPLEGIEKIKTAPTYAYFTTTPCRNHHVN